MDARTPLKFENTAEIGDRIKAFDFEPRPGLAPSFVTGPVTAKGLHPEYGFACYTIRAEEDAVSDRVGLDVFVPFQVSPLDWEGRVTRV